MDLPFTAEQFFGVFADYNRTFSGSAAMLLAVPTDDVLLGAGVLLATLRIRQVAFPRRESNDHWRQQPTWGPACGSEFSWRG